MAIPMSIKPYASAQDLWQSVLVELQLQMTRATFDAWLKPTFGMSLSEGELVVGVPTPTIKEWLETRLVEPINRSIESLAGKRLGCAFVISDAPAAPPNFEQHSLPMDGPLPVAHPAPTPLTLPPPKLNPRYTFDTYVVGPGTRLAHAAAQAVAEQPAARYNPLFIYGGVGLGKTHLLHAIAHALYQRQFSVSLVSSEKFTNDLIESIRQQSTEEFRSVYRSVDVLLIDDIHFIAGKEATQEEFFHTFNAIHGGEGQIVLTSDRPPHAIATLEDRLRSRFQWGLQVDIEPPDFETRIAILRAKTQRAGTYVPDAVIELVANAVQQNVRELEGALNRVVAFTQYNHAPLTTDLARQALADILTRRQKPTTTQVLRAVADHFRLSEEELLGRSRAVTISEPRQVAMYLMREDADASLPAIGAALGGRDHTTVLHGSEKIAHLLEQDAQLRRAILQIRERLYGK